MGIPKCVIQNFGKWAIVMTGIDGLPILSSWDASDGLNMYARDHAGTLRNCILTIPTTMFALGHITS